MTDRNIPIGRQLTKIILIASLSALLFTCAVFFGYEYTTYRQNALSDLQTLGRIIAANSTAALAFDSPDDARETLAALKTERQIVAAALYGPDGKLFAAYPANQAATSLPAAPGAGGYRFAHGFVEGFERVAQGDNKSVGTLYLRSDRRALTARFKLYGLVAATVLALSVLMVLALSRRLQRQVSEPILALAETARAVSQNRDYSVRAPSAPGRELGILTDAFNQMLAQSESYETSQREGRAKLESQLERMNLLSRITRAISERQQLHDVFQVVADTLEANMPIDFGCVCLYEAGATSVTVAVTGQRCSALAADLAMAAGSQIEIGDQGFAHALRGTLIHESDILKIESPFTRNLAAAGLASLVIAPLRAESQVFGLLVAARRSSRAFTSADCEFLLQLSEHVALASHQTQLYGALRKAYEDLRQSQQAVLQQERLRALGEMASGIAHDVNNALSPVALYTESLLERESNLTERGRKNLETIQRAVDDVAETVARLRQFYRPRESQLLLSEVDVNDLVCQVIDLTRVRWSDMPQEAGVVVELVKDLAEGLPKIMGAESEIRDALTNLIFNAVDAMPKGGELALRSRLFATSKHRDDALRSIVVEVSDSGIGMDEETRRRCLEPFYTTKGERGTGLGLAMVFGMAQRHSADLEIDSRPGSGTTVRLIFSAQPTATDAIRVERTRRVLQPQRILIVDDDPLMLKSLQDTLEGDGHIVTATEGGQAGITAFTAAHARGEPYAALITDLGMPYVDGRKVAAAVRALSPTVAIILLTGWGRRMIEEEDSPPGVDRVMSKPPKIAELRAVLADLIAGPALKLSSAL